MDMHYLDLKYDFTPHPDTLRSLYEAAIREPGKKGWPGIKQLSEAMANRETSEAAEAVERAITLAVERKQWERNGSLYVSDVKHALPVEAGGDCKLKLHAKLRDEPQKPLTPGVEMMFSMGDTVHEKVVDWLREHLDEDEWFVAAVEERARDGIEPLRGRLDIALRCPTRQVEIVVDVKTKRGNAFHYLDGPKAADRLQVQCYIEARENATGGLLVYVDREGQNFIKVFPVAPDPDAVRNAIDELVKIRKFAREGMWLEEWLVPPKLTRNQNKGRDSLKVEWPWQVEWCSLDSCYCKEAAPDALKNAPSGIVGWVAEEEQMPDGSIAIAVELKEQYQGTALEAWISEQMRMGNYVTS